MCIMKRVNDIEPLGTKSRLQNILDNIKVFYRIKDQQDAILVHDVLIIIFKFMVPFEEVAEFLKSVAYGEQEGAQAILKKNFNVSLFPGNVVDLSGREFYGTGLQYALWFLDSRMYRMIAKDMPIDIIKQQIVVLRNGALKLSDDTRGDVLLQNLINALSEFINLCKSNKQKGAGSYWDKQVGTAQQQLPAHAVHEYCDPKQPLKEFQNINYTAALPRSRTTSIGDWFEATYNGGKIGSGFFAYYRGGSRNYPYPSRGEEQCTTQTTYSKQEDLDALTRYRAQQLVALRNFLQDLNKIPADNANQGLKFK